MSKGRGERCEQGEKRGEEEKMKTCTRKGSRGGDDYEGKVGVEGDNQEDANNDHDKNMCKLLKKRKVKVEK